MKKLILFTMIFTACGCGSDAPTPKTDAESLKKVDDDVIAARNGERGGKGQTKGKTVKNKDGIPAPE